MELCNVGDPKNIARDFVLEGTAGTEALDQAVETLRRGLGPMELRPTIKAGGPLLAAATAVTVIGRVVP